MNHPDDRSGQFPPVAPSETPTPLCECKGHPFNCYNHPRDCGCTQLDEHHERAEFERLFAPIGFDIGRDMGAYSDGQTRCAWHGWIERAKRTAGAERG